jgi:hypothetical protein
MNIVAFLGSITAAQYLKKYKEDSYFFILNIKF